MFVKKSYLTIFLLLAALLAGFLFFTQSVFTQKKTNLSLFKGTLLQVPRELNAFSFTGIDGKPFDNTSLTGQWTMIFFGFTHCGYLCPTTMAQLAKMYRMLEKNKVQPLPKVMMITLDPDRDDLVALSAYVKAFHSQFYGARGDKAVLAALTQELGIAYEKALPAQDHPENYTFEHSGAVMLINPQGKLSAFFTSPQKAEWLVGDYQLLIS